MSFYIAVGREVQLRLDRSRGGHSSIHQMGKLHKDARMTQNRCMTRAEDK